MAAGCRKKKRQLTVEIGSTIPPDVIFIYWDLVDVGNTRTDITEPKLCSIPEIQKDPHFPPPIPFGDRSSSRGIPPWPKI